MPGRLNRANFDAGMRAAATRRAHRVGQEIVNEARQRCPVDEGKLRGSIDYTIKAGGEQAKVTVGSPLDYARYVHEGTGIYGPKGTPIVPVSAPALTFKWEPAGGGPKKKAKDKRGQFSFKSVKGQKPNPFLADAVEAVMGNITRRNSPS